MTGSRNTYNREFMDGLDETIRFIEIGIVQLLCLEDEWENKSIDKNLPFFRFRDR